MSFTPSIGDVMMLSQLAWKIGCAFTSGRAGAPAEFQEVENELTSLTRSLTLLAETLDKDDSIMARADEKIKEGLGKILECCRHTLDSLDSFVDAYQELRKPDGSGALPAQRSWKQVLIKNYKKIWWTTEEGDIQALRDMLQVHVNSISLTMQALQSKSLARLENTIEPMAEKVDDMHNKLNGDLNVKISEMHHLMLSLRSVEASPQIWPSGSDAWIPPGSSPFLEPKKSLINSFPLPNMKPMREGSKPLKLYTPEDTPELVGSEYVPRSEQVKSMSSTSSRDSFLDRRESGLIPLEYQFPIRSVHESPPPILAKVNAEIRNREPGSSQESVCGQMYQISIFNRSSSTSDSVASEQEVRTPNHRPPPLMPHESWYGGDAGKAQVETPTSIHSNFPRIVDHSPRAQLPHFVEELYDTDRDEPSQSHPMHPIASDSTARPHVALTAGQDEGWQTVPPSKRVTRARDFQAAPNWNQGRWKEAEELEVQVMKMSLRVLGEEHPDTLISMANLASTSWYSAVKEALRKRILKWIPGGESPLKPGMKRVRWTCVCNRRYYDDFYEVRPGAIQDMQEAMNAIFHTVQSPTSVHLSSTMARASQYIKAFPLEGPNGGIAYTIFIDHISAAFSMNKVGMDEMIRGLFTVIIASITVISLSLIAVFALMLVSVNDPLLSPDDSKGAYDDSLPLPAHDWVPVERAPASQFSQAVVSDRGKGKQPSDKQSLDSGEGPSRRRGTVRESMDIGDNTTRRVSSDDNSSGSKRVKRVKRVKRGERHGNQNQQLWAIPLFLNSEREAIAIHVDVSERKTDYSLFRKFHQEYFIVSSGWQRFTQLHQVGKIQFVQFALTDYDRADVRRINVWPPKHDPQMWFYEPYPATEENIPLVGGQYLMNVWRDAHHADVAAYREYQRTAKWHRRLLDWLKHIIHSVFQALRDFFSDGADPDHSRAESNVLPPNIQATDIEQPEKQPRSRHIVRSVPKIGGKISVNFRDDNSPDAWGLQFKESFHFHRLLFFVLLIFATVSLGVTIGLFRHYGLSGPSSVGSIVSVASWLLALFSLTVTVWCKWAENSPLD